MLPTLPEALNITARHVKTYIRRKTCREASQ